MSENQICVKKRNQIKSTPYLIDILMIFWKEGLFQSPRYSQGFFFNYFFRYARTNLG
jgi:hypothetical protein